LLEKQDEPLSEGLLSHGSDDRLERLTLGDLGRNWNNNSLLSTDTMRNLEDNGNPDTSSSNVRGIAAISSLTSIETADYSTPEIKKVATRANIQPSVYDISDENNNIIVGLAISRFSVIAYNVYAHQRYHVQCVRAPVRDYYIPSAHCATPYIATYSPQSPTVLGVSHQLGINSLY